MPKERDIKSVKNSIRALLISAKSGLTPLELRRDYEATIGHPIPVFELGYSSLFELLKSIPDAVAMHKSRGSLILSAVTDESSRHIATLVARQKSSKPYSAMKSGMPGRSDRFTSSSPMPPPISTRPKPEVSSLSRIKLNQLMMSYPNGLPISKFQEAFSKRFGHYFNVSSIGFTSLLQALHTVDTIELKPHTKETGDYIIKSVVPSRKGKSVSSVYSLEKTALTQKAAPVACKIAGDPVPVEIGAQIFEVLKSAPGGIWASDFPVKYKIHFNEDLPFKSLNYTSVVEMVMNIPNVVDLERPISNGDWLLFAKGKKTPSPLVTSTKSNLQITPSVPSSLSNLIQYLIRNSSATVCVADFLTFFKEATGKDLSFDDYGFLSLEELLNAVPDVHIITNDKGKKILSYTEPEKEIIKDKDVKDCAISNTMKEVNPSQNLDPQVFSGYSRVSVPTGSKTFGVYVTYVKTPSYLCVQVIGEDTTYALDSLHEDMAHFYNGASGDKFAITDPKPGMCCCSRYNNDGYWYRAVVMNVELPDIVEVKYVDYGNCAKVALRALRKPKPHYLSLPAQALECRLSNIVPLSGTWSKRACCILSEMTKDKPIAAIVTSVKGNVVSLCLCDTNTDKDIHINECLIEQGLALLSSDTEKEEENIDEYDMQKPSAESSVDDMNVRLPNTASTVECASKASRPETAHLSQMFQLMNDFLKQQTLVPTTAVPTSSTVPVTVNSSVSVPPGFEKVSSSTTVISSTSTSEQLATDPIKSNETKNNIDNVSIKKVSLPQPYTLHLIRHNNHPYAVSTEISSWFWESDLLQYKLYKIPNSPCGQLIHRDTIPELFQLLVNSQCPSLWEALVKQTITVYSLEVLPAIVESLGCPAVLSKALALVVKEWKEQGQNFWINAQAEALRKEKEMTIKLKKLQQERTLLLSSLAKKSNDCGSSISTNELFVKFMTLDKEIDELKKKLSEIELKSKHDRCDNSSQKGDKPSPTNTSRKLSPSASSFLPRSSNTSSQKVMPYTETTHPTTDHMIPQPFIPFCPPPLLPNPPPIYAMPPSPIFPPHNQSFFPRPGYNFNQPRPNYNYPPMGQPSIGIGRGNNNKGVGNNYLFAASQVGGNAGMDIL